MNDAFIKQVAFESKDYALWKQSFLEQKITDDNSQLYWTQTDVFILVIIP